RPAPAPPSRRVGAAGKRARKAASARSASTPVPGSPGQRLGRASGSAGARGGPKSRPPTASRPAPSGPAGGSSRWWPLARQPAPGGAGRGPRGGQGAAVKEELDQGRARGQPLADFAGRGPSAQPGERPAARGQLSLQLLLAPLQPLELLSGAPGVRGWGRRV